MASVVVVEDDDAVRSALIRALRRHGHVATGFATGTAGLPAMVESAPDVVVLDLGLPDLDGGDVLSMLRAVSTVPVIVATARDEEAEMIRILDAGADDYVVKPFTAGQLDARIRAVMRRGGALPDEGEPPITVGGLVVDPSRREVVLDDRRVELNRKEFELLLALARRAGRVVTRRTLLTEVWQQPWGGSDRTVDVHLSWLRRKLGETAREPRYLHSVRGIGVRLAAPTAPTSRPPQPPPSR